MKIGKLYIQYYLDENPRFYGKERVIFKCLKDNKIKIMSEIINESNTFPIEKGRILNFEEMAQKDGIKELESHEIIKYKLLGYL